MSRYVSEDEAMDIAIDSFSMSIPQLAEKYDRKQKTIQRALVCQVELINKCREALWQSKIALKVEKATELERLRLAELKKQVAIAKEELNAIQSK